MMLDERADFVNGSKQLKYNLVRQYANEKYVTEKMVIDI